MPAEVKKNTSAPIKSSDLEVLRRVLKVGREAIEETTGPSSKDDQLLPYDSSVPFPIRESELHRRRFATGNFSGKPNEGESEQKPEEPDEKPH